MHQSWIAVLAVAVAVCLAGCIKEQPDPPPGPAIAIDAPLEGTYWKFVTIAADAALPAAIAREAYLQFDAAGRVSGSTGVNRLNGSYTREGAALSFGPIATTRMAGSEAAMTQETAINAAMQKVAAHRISGTTLKLLDAAGTELATLAAATPPAN